jgi:hypothetical protein
MKSVSKTVILAVAIALLAVSVQAVPTTAAAPKSAVGAPKAVAVEPIFDAGEIAKGEKLTHDFVLRNDGTTTLEVTDVRPSCGCTVASYDKQIAPGASGKIHTVLDTVQLTGPSSKGLSVFTNDPAAPEIQLTIHLKVVPYIDVKPGYARFNVVRGMSETAKIVETLYGLDNQMTAITGVDSPYPFLSATYREAQEGERLPEIKAKQWRLEVVMSADAPVGPIAGNMVVHTNHPKQPMVIIPITGFVRPTLAVTPPIGDFGTVKVEGPVTHNLHVKVFATEPIHVIGVDTSSKSIQASIRPLQDGREYEIDVTLASTIEKGPLHGKLTIHTDSPKSPLVEVEIKGVVQ